MQASRVSSAARILKSLLVIRASGSPPAQHVSLVCFVINVLCVLWLRSLRCSAVTLEPSCSDNGPHVFVQYTIVVYT